MRQFSLWFCVYIYVPAKIQQHFVNKKTQKDVLNRVPTFKTSVKEKVLQHVDGIQFTEVCVLLSGHLQY